MSDNALPPNHHTRVTVQNWSTLQQQGVVSVINAEDEPAGLSPINHATIVREVLRWELGADQVLEGEPYLPHLNGPTDLPEYRGMIGFYALSLPAGWSQYWDRWVLANDPRALTAKLNHLLPSNGDADHQWEIWAVHGQDDTYRCMRTWSNYLPRHEGSFDSVVAYIRHWEAENPDHI